MKKYKQLITEIAFIRRILADYQSKKELYDAIESIEARYPGVNHFLYAASRWASDVSPNRNPALYDLLVRMSGKSSIHDFEENDLRAIYKYIIKDKELRRPTAKYSDFEQHFIEASEYE